MVEALRNWAQSSAVIRTTSADSRMTHGNLKPDQVFIADGGYRIIDWQRPIEALPDVDLASLERRTTSIRAAS
jgi:hypothetical protein